MAVTLTEEVLARFRGPIVWGESDCIAWLAACTGLPIPTVWYAEHRSEARALAAVARRPGGFVGAVRDVLRAGGYGELQAPFLWHPEPGDVLIVDDPVHSPSPCGVAPGPTVLLRHPNGIAQASGAVLHHLRRV